MPVERLQRPKKSHDKPYTTGASLEMEDEEVLPSIPTACIIPDVDCEMNDISDNENINSSDENINSNDRLIFSSDGQNRSSDGNLNNNMLFPPMHVHDDEKQASKIKVNIRRIQVPPHRFTPLKKSWLELIAPLIKHMKLQVRMNTKRKCVELRMDKSCTDISYLSKGADYIRAFMLGFDLIDAVALLRLDDLFLESFEIKDVKRLVGDNFTRCIGRISGKDGKVKHAIENSTRTRLVIADRYIHILGAFTNIRLARHSICSLILGSPPGKVYNRLRNISKRLKERR